MQKNSSHLTKLSILSLIILSLVGAIFTGCGGGGGGTTTTTSSPSPSSSPSYTPTETLTMNIDAQTNCFDTFDYSTEFVIVELNSNTSYSVEVTSNATYRFSNELPLFIMRGDSALGATKEFLYNDDISIFNVGDYPRVRAFYIDSTKEDNSGQATMVIKNVDTTIASETVDAVNNCIDISGSSKVVQKTLTAGNWTGTVENNATTAEGDLPAIAIIYDSVTDQKAYMVLYNGASVSTGASYGGGWIKFFYFDYRVSDNSGSAELILKK